MKKILSLLLVCTSVLCAVSCSDKKNESSSIPEGKTSSDFDRVSSEEELKARERAVETDGQFVYDDSRILTTAEFDSLNSFLAWFAKAFKMNAAVVLTDDLGESSPYEYAKSFYTKNYEGDGILFLINNDTNEDYIHLAGRVTDYISGDKNQLILAEISPMLALGDYNSAAERIFEEAELSLPEYFTDRSGTVSAEDIMKYNEILKEACGSSTLNLYYVKGTGDDKIDKFAKDRFDMFFESGSDTAMLVVNGDNGESCLCTSGKYDTMQQNADELKEYIKGLYSKKDGVKLERACEVFVSFSKGEKPSE